MDGCFSLILRLLYFPSGDETPRGCFRSFPRPHNTNQCGEVSSPQVVINMVIHGLGRCGERKSPDRRFDKRARAGLVFEDGLEQIEFLRATDSSPTGVHPKLVVNILCVGTHGIQGYL